MNNYEQIWTPFGFSIIFESFIASRWLGRPWLFSWAPRNREGQVFFSELGEAISNSNPGTDRKQQQAWNVANHVLESELSFVDCLGGLLYHVNIYANHYMWKYDCIPIVTKMQGIFFFQGASWCVASWPLLLSLEGIFRLQLLQAEGAKHENPNRSERKSYATSWDNISGGWGLDSTLLLMWWSPKYIKYIQIYQAMSPNTSIIKPFWPLSAARITTDLTWRVAETWFALPFFSRLSDGRCALCFCNLHVKDVNEHLAFVWSAYLIYLLCWQCFYGLPNCSQCFVDFSVRMPTLPSRKRRSGWMCCGNSGALRFKRWERHKRITGRRHPPMWSRLQSSSGWIPSDLVCQLEVWSRYIHGTSWVSMGFVILSGWISSGKLT